MQIFELTQPKKRHLNELDFGLPPPKKNFGAGVGPGVQPQYTATPRIKAAPTPGPAPQLPPPLAATTAMTAATPTPKLQTIAAPAQLTGPAGAKQIGTNYDPNVIDVDAKEKPAATTAALPAAAPPASQPVTPPAPQPTTAAAPPASQPAPASTVNTTTGIDPMLAAANTVKMTGPQGRKPSYGQAFSKAINAYNAGKVGLSYLLPKEPDQEVYTDPKGKITVGGKPYDARNPEHQRLVGTITIGGKPYNGANPEHQAAYLAFKKTAGRGDDNLVQIDRAGKVTVAGQPFDPSNITHVRAYRQHQLSQLVRQTAPPAATPQPVAATGSPEVVQALTKMQYTPQQAAALAAKVPPGTSVEDAVKQILQGKIAESLSWSRGFDPSHTLLKKMKSQL